MTALFTKIGRSTYRASDLTQGPWDPAAQHGGPSAALMAGAIDSTPGNGGNVARISVEIFGPIPISVLDLTTEILRPGRRIELIGATLRSEGRTVARATAWRFASGTIDVPEDRGEISPTAPESLPADPDVFPGRFAGEAVDIRHTVGAWRTPGPATAWLRLRVPVVADEETTPLQRAAATADFTNGIGARLSFERYLFINTDVSLHLYRFPVGEWIGLDADTHLGADGRGLATGLLFDVNGPIGRSNQTLLVARR